MAFTAEAIARLKLDTTDFQRGLTKTSADVGKVGEDINRKLKRAFGGGDFFKGILQGMGIGSVQGLMDKLTEGWSKAAEHAKDIAESTAKTLGIYQQIFASRRTDQQNLEQNLKEQARLQKVFAEANTEKSEMRNVFFPGQRQALPTNVITQHKNAQKAKEASEGLAELAKEEFALREKIKDTTAKTAADQKKFAADQRKALDDLAEFEAETARDQLDTMEQIADAETRLAALRQALIEDDSEDIELKKEIAKLERERLALQKKLAAEQKKTADETEREAEKREEIVKRIRDAERALSKSKEDAATADRDRTGWTIGELASAPRGSGVNQTQKAQAREVMRLERVAKINRAGGRDNEASMRMQWADTIRDKMGMLTSGEKNPMAAAAEGIKKSEEHLAEIRKSLKPEAVKK